MKMWFLHGTDRATYLMDSVVSKGARINKHWNVAY